MKYRIERMEGQHCHFVNGRTELLAYLEQAPAGTVTDIRKVYQNGVTDSVMEIYLPYIRGIEGHSPVSPAGGFFIAASCRRSMWAG